mgnify:FL=1
MAKNSRNQVQSSQNVVRSLTNSPQLQQTINSLLKALNQKNDRSAFEFTENLQWEIDWRGGQGILFQMANPNNHVMRDLDFLELRNEVIHFDELSTIVQNGMQMPNNSPMWAAFESVLVDEITREFKQLIEQSSVLKPLKSDFMAHISGVRSPEVLISLIDGFASNLNNANQKKEFQKIIKDYKISFSTIAQRLQAKWLDMSSLQNPYTQWSAENKVLWDGILSQLVIGRFQGRVQDLNTLVEWSIGVFDRALPTFAIFFEKYPFDYQALQQKYPEKWKEIETLQTQAGEAKDDATLEQINQQIQNLEFSLYLQSLSEQNAQLAQVMQKLVASNCDFSKLSSAELDCLMKEIVDITIDKYKDKNLIKVFEQMGGSGFETFFRELFDMNKTSLKLWGVDLPITKKIIGNTAYNLQNLEDFAQMDLPLEFELKNIDQAGISVENRASLEALFEDEMSEDKKSIKLWGRDIGKLLYLWMMSNQDKWFENFERKELLDKGISNLFSEPDQAVNRVELEKLKDQLQDEESPEELIEKWVKELNDFWKGIKGGKFETWPQVWDYLYFEDSALDSMIPPYDVGWGDGSQEKVRMEISRVDNETGKISFKMYGTEIALSQNDEGVEYTLDMSLFVEKMKERKNLIKIPRDQQDSKWIIDSLSNADISGDKLWWVKIEDGKLMFDQYDEEGNATQVEATHFAVYDKVSDQKSGFSREKIIYQTKMIDNDTVEVTGDVPDMNWETKHYKKTMKLSDFLLFVANKHLLPKTKEQVEAELKTQGEIPGKKQRVWKWMSIRAMTSSVKTVWKNLTAKIESRYKEQDDLCLNWLIDDFWIYDKIAKIIPWDVVKSAANSLRDEAISKVEGKTWAVIEDWLKRFEGMWDFATFFRTGKDDFTGLKQAALWWKTLQQILESGETVVNNPKLRPIMAAAMIANLKKWAGLYRNVQWGENKALWVKCLLGNDHHKRYMEMKNDIIARIQAGAADSDQLQDRLKNSEIDYIVNNIRGADVGLDFGSVKGNDTSLRKIYSSKFAGALEGEKKQTDSLIQEEYGKLKHQNFEKAFNDFKSMIKSGRFERGIANLMRMVDLTGKSGYRMDQVRRAFSFVVLSGMMNRYGGDKLTRKFFDQLAITLQIPTAFWTKKRDHWDNAWHLMNKIPPAEWQRSFGQYLEEKGLKKSDFSHRSWKIDYAGFMDHLWHWRDMNQAQVNGYFDSLFIREWGKNEKGEVEKPKFDPIEKKVNDQLWKRQSDKVYANWAKNPVLMSLNGLQKGVEVFQLNMGYNQNGFDWEDADVRNDKALFRKEVTNDLKATLERQKNANEGRGNPADIMNLFLKIFSTRMTEADYPGLVSVLKTARYVKQNQGKKIEVQKEGVLLNLGIYQNSDSGLILDYFLRSKLLTMRNFAPPIELQKFVEVFVQYFQDNLWEMDDNVLKEVFWEKVLKDTDAKAKLLIPWPEYNKYNGDEIISPDEEDSEDEEEHNTNLPLSKKQQNAERNKMRKFYNQEDFLNKSIIEMERRMEKSNLRTKSLSGVSKQSSVSYAQQVYWGD